MNQILIVDDSPTIRRMVRASLTGLARDLEIIEAASGLEAIERLALGAVELMVLDLNMPDMHGLEVLGFVRSHQKYRPRAGHRPDHARRRRQPLRRHAGGGHRLPDETVSPAGPGRPGKRVLNARAAPGAR